MALRSLLAVASLAAVFSVPAAAQSPLRADLGPPWLVDGKLSWPPNDGCDGAAHAESLQPGARIDRYGSENGSYFATPGTAYEARALPYDPTKLPYTVYVVKKQFTVQECKIAAWFGEPGGGEQFKANESAAQLRSEGMIDTQ